MSENIDLAVRAIDNASGALRTIAKELEDLRVRTNQLDAKTKELNNSGASLQNFGTKWTELRSKVSLAMQAIQTGIDVAKKAMEFGQEGAQLEFVMNKFDRLSESVGTTADALMTDLRVATRGLVSDAQLMDSAANFMSLGLAKSHDEVVRLTKVAGGLGMNLNQLVLTLTNKTTMRFDALGVSVDGFKERVDALKEAGLDADAAFTEAFLRQAEEQLLLVGERADQSVGSFDRMNAAIENATNTAKLESVPVFKQLADAIYYSLTPAEDRYQLLIDTSNELAASTLSEEEYRAKLVEVAASLGFTITKTGELRQGNERFTRELPLLTAAQRAQIAATDAATTAGKAYVTQLLDRIGVTGETVTAEEYHKQKLEEVKQKMEALSLFMSGPLGKEYDTYNEKQEALRAKMQEVRDKIAELNADEYLTEEQQGELDGLHAEMDELKNQYAENAAAHEEATRRIIFGIVQQQLAMDGLTETEGNALVILAEKWGLIDERTRQAYEEIVPYVGQLADGKLTASQFADHIDRIPQEKNITITATYHGPNLDSLGSGGIASQYNQPSYGGSSSGGSSSVRTRNIPRAAGGPVGPGSYLVGERQPETLVLSPGSSGYIVPHATTNNFYLTANYANQSPVSLAADVRMLSRLYGGRR